MKNSHKIIFFVVAISAAIFIFYIQKTINSRIISYPNFGIQIPAGYQTHGIDVSRYQQNIEWEEVVKMKDQGKGISFAIVKSTEGTDLIDPFFKQNWSNLNNQNLVKGAYLYFRVNRNPEEQARLFIRNTPLRTGDLPPIIDIEDTHNRNSNEIKVALKKCIKILEEQFRVKPIIYTGVSFYQNYLDEEFKEYPLWIAHYEQAIAPQINRDWIMWQHNCQGHVNGIRGEVDFNVFNGTLSALKSLCL